jgi:N-acetylmuramic acid 6-phosphate etherase
MKSITESDSIYTDLEKKSVLELLKGINEEDKKVPIAVEKVIPQIGILVEKIVEKMKLGGRLFYIGAGTSGRLGVVDASECPPTYGVPHGLVVGLIAGGDAAIRKSVEHAEDDPAQGWKDLQSHDFGKNDCLIGIAASGRTPYVIGAVQKARKNGNVTGCITCNSTSELAAAAEFPIEVIVGPEFVTGSTRMKSGTAQKLVLNMISTTTMIQLGKVKGNKMVDMQLSNEKLKNRGLEMLMAETGLEAIEAQKLLNTHGSVRKALEAYQNNA